jgi:hypothetical protein
LHRQLARPFGPQDAIDIRSRAADDVERVRSV